MALPRQVEQDAEAAEALQRDLYGEVQPAAEPSQTAQPDPQPQPQPQPTAQVIEMPAKAEPVAAAPEEDVGYWKSRFSTLQGKYNAEVPLLQRQLRELSEQLNTLRAAAEQPQKPTQAAETTSLVSEKDVEEFGPDLIDFARRVAREEAQKAYAAERAALEKKFGAVEASVGDVANRVIQSDTDRFWSRVATLVPDWPQIDKDPGWIEFLDSRIPGTVRTYREEAGNVIAAGDPEPIKELVNAWKATNARSQSAPAAVQTQSRPASTDLSRQVAPNTTRTTAAPSAAPKMISRAEYEALYDPRNVIRYGQKQADEMIAEADRAVVEGRVQW